ncbi:hypothetical protein EGW08_021992 [Elysia chlorotica]|uniref:Uncharacterized protein n=1 Tax=Elysia chlorotica TaxID=188477 RepID=A0A433SM81_ELYCH|nr:hypothetical protein EGW08_021992 [Elysia chlorotica]
MKMLPVGVTLSMFLLKTVYSLYVTLSISLVNVLRLRLDLRLDPRFRSQDLTVSSGHTRSQSPSVELQCLLLCIHPAHNTRATNRSRTSVSEPAMRQSRLIRKCCEDETSVMRPVLFAASKRTEEIFQNARI